MNRLAILLSAGAAALPALAQEPPVVPAINVETEAPAKPVVERPLPPRALTPAMIRVFDATRAAVREPRSPGFVHGVQVYPYSEGVLYRLFAAPERVTDIALQPGETIVSVAAGDTVRWTVGDTTSGSGEAKRAHILIKPFAAGLNTNLVITTDRRVYHLLLESTARVAMAGLAWSYPQDELLAIRRAAEAQRATAPVASGLMLEALDFSYEVSGDSPAWRPIRAFDDGRQSYIEFPAGIAVGEAPPLFVIGEDGEPALVNYRVAGRFYVVDRLFAAAELRLGGKRQAIVRITRSEPARGRKGRAS
jgi:type IV secretion system protein VirB9